MTRLESRVLDAIRKAHRPPTVAYLSVVLNRRVDAALEALVAGGLIIRVRDTYLAAPPPEVTERTRVEVCRDGYADGYGWGGED